MAKKANVKKDNKVVYILTSTDGQIRTYYAPEVDHAFLAEAKKRFETDTGRVCHRARWELSSKYKPKAATPSPETEPQEQ